MTKRTDYLKEATSMASSRRRPSRRHGHCGVSRTIDSISKRSLQNVLSTSHPTSTVNLNSFWW